MEKLTMHQLPAPVDVPIQRPGLHPATAARRAAQSVLLLAVALLTACSSVRPWINEPLPATAKTTIEHQELLQQIAARDPSMLVAVTLSGGGARAAAFGYGVLSAMQEQRFHWNDKDTTLLNTVDVVSGVSGGSMVAAYFAANGIEGLHGFEHAFLRQNFQGSLLSLAMRPDNLMELTSPWMGRSHLLARQLDKLYGGMTFGELEQRPRHPQLVISATDMSRGTAFEFTWDQFSLICSDLSSVPLSFAVAASSSVPLLLSPMTLKNYAGECTHPSAASVLDAQATGGGYRARLYRAHKASYLNAERKPYVHLLDGGLADNLGVQRLLDRALGGDLRRTFSEVHVPPGTIQKLVLIMVNAERDPEYNIDESDEVPNMAQVIDSMLFGAGARATSETQEFLRDTIDQWRKALASGATDMGDAFAPDAQIHVIQVNLRDAPDVRARKRLLKVPTAFSISSDEVSELIEAGGNVLRHSAEFKALMKSLSSPTGVTAAQP